MRKKKNMEENETSADFRVLIIARAPGGGAARALPFLATKTRTMMMKGSMKDNDRSKHDGHQSIEDEINRRCMATARNNNKTFLSFWYSILEEVQQELNFMLQAAGWILSN